MFRLRRTRLVVGTVSSLVFLLAGCTQESGEPGESGESAQWELTSTSEITAQSTTLRVGVSRLGSATSSMLPA